MTLRSPVNALSNLNKQNYLKVINFLTTFMEIGIKELWKPCHAEILISTKSILDIQKLLC